MGIPEPLSVRRATVQTLTLFLFMLESGEVYRAIICTVFMKLTKIDFSVSIVVLSIFLSFISCRNNKIEVSSNPVNSTINNTPPTIKVFLENSGSMDGYMCDCSHLKDV